MTIDTPLPPIPQQPEQSSTKEKSLPPTILKVMEESPDTDALKQTSKYKPLPPMPPPDESTTPASDPAVAATATGPGSKSDPKTAEFQGDVQVSNELPTKEMIEKAADILVFDTEGKEVLFKSLYLPQNNGEERRTLIIFVRHFFCGVSPISSSQTAISLPPLKIYN
jgi:hypothetical protein